MLETVEVVAVVVVPNEGCLRILLVLPLVMVLDGATSKSNGFCGLTTPPFLLGNSMGAAVMGGLDLNGRNKDGLLGRLIGVGKNLELVLVEMFLVS